MRAGIVIYPDVEPIDLATLGVLSMARRIDSRITFYTVAEQAGPVRLANGLVVLAEHGFADAPAADVLIVTGGPGWQAQCASGPMRRFLRARAATDVVASVCTGGMILAAAGLLDGGPATTKREVTGAEASPLGLLAARHPAVEAVPATWVDRGAVVTGGGVTLCIDTTLHLLARFAGRDVARETARIIEYQRALDANAAGLPPLQVDVPEAAR